MAGARGARTIGGSLLYFAYGSNLEPVQMGERCPGHVVVGLASLADHRLVFPRTSKSWGGGVAGVAPAPGETVWGVAFELTAAHLESLDAYEGFHGPGDPRNAYARVGTPIAITRADDGSAPRLASALIYVAEPTPGAEPDLALPPSRRYLDVILTGA